METITNAATAVTSTVSGLIYGQPAKEGEANTTSTNETGGKEPLSGAQGKGTVNEPFDKGNAENSVDTSSSANTTVPASGNTSYKDDDFLKLNPTLGKPTTDSSSAANTSSTGESAIPIIPLNPDASTSNTNPASSATGVTDKIWKPTELDDVSRAGAPGAGNSAPDFKPAAGDTSLSVSEKPTESATTASDSAPNKATTGVATSHSDSAKNQTHVGGPIEEVLKKGTSSKAEHTVKDSEASDPHSKMSDKTVRATDTQRTGEGATVESHPAETTTSRTSESSKSPEPASPMGGEEKSEKKMDKLKDKLKNKLHIGSKDK